MNTIQQALLGLAAAFKSPYYKGTDVPKGRNNEIKKSGKTRRGAVHKQGRVFRSRHITAVRTDAGMTRYVTPAQYRGLHLGAGAKKKESK